MPKDWDAVAAVVTKRMEDLDLTQAEVSHRAGLSLQTVRELQHNLAARKRSSRTLGTMSTALGLPYGHLEEVLNGRDPGDPDEGDPVLTELAELRELITTVTERLDAIERQLGTDGERS